MPEMYVSMQRKMVPELCMELLQRSLEMSILLSEDYMKVGSRNLKIIGSCDKFLAFLGYNWDKDLRESLMDPFRAAVERRAAGTYCGTKYKVLADPLEKSIKNADL